MNLALYHQSVIVDTQTDQATFILTNFDEKMTGYQKYNPKGNKTLRKNQDEAKYFTHVSKGNIGAWGLEYQSEEYPQILIIVEGVFKACRFHKHDIQAIATLTSNPKFAKMQFVELRQKYLTIVIPDPDMAGRKLIKYGKTYLEVDEPIDEMSDESFMRLVNKIKNMEVYDER
jgi:hypothetical protein